MDHTRYGASADVFSFGIVVIEVLSMKRPYEELSGISDVALFFKIFHEDLRPSLDGVPEDLHGILGAVLARDPSSRPTMLEVKDALRAFHDLTSSTKSLSAAV